MNPLNPKDHLWFERTQDMSGFMLPDLISLPLDEQFNPNFSTAQHENDFDIQKSDNQSPEEVILGEADTVLEDDSNMFDNSNYSVLDSEIKTWLPSISEIDEFVQTTAEERLRGFLNQTDSENSLTFLTPPTEDKKISTLTKKPRYLSIFDCEEPHIKDEQDTLSFCCTDSKLTEMEVAAEEEVVTEQEENSKLNLSESNANLDSLWIQSPVLDFPVRIKKEVFKPESPFAELSPSPNDSIMHSPYRPNFLPIVEEESMLDWGQPIFLADPKPEPRVNPQLELRLDIGAAMVSANQLFGAVLPDTPEVLKPVLKPEAEFDLVNFLLASGDNNIIATTSSVQPVVNCPQEQRQGKSHLSLQELMASQTSRKRRVLTSTAVEEQRFTPDACSSCDRLSLESVPSTSLSATENSRPRRESASRFLSSLQHDSNSVSSEDEGSTPKSKRRRTISSPRKRLTSESDLSSIGDRDSVSKYRERRDRNNVSSKKSRQKRKVTQELKKMELKDLEKENKRLKKKADELALVLDKVHNAWKEYLSTTIKTEN